MKLLFLDTETGGLDEDKHSLLTIGMVVWENKKIMDRLSSAIRKENYCCDHEAMAINGLDLHQSQQSGMLEKEVLEAIEMFCSKHFGDTKIVLAGHNIKFDIAFLKKLYQTYDINFDKRFDHKTIDIVSIIKFLVLQGKIREDRESFDKLMAHYQIPIQGRHTALGDALATAYLFNSADMKS